MPILLYVRMAAWIGGAGLLIWVVDEIGDRREKKVRAEIAQQVRAANARAEDAELKWKTKFDADTAEREKVLADTIAGVRTMAAGSCELPASVRDQLNRINPRRR